MSTDATYRTALAQAYQPGESHLQRGDARSVQLLECPHAQLAIVRVPAQALAAQDAVGRALGVTLPLTPNTVSQEGPVCAWWLSPDEWLLRSEAPQGAQWVAQVEAALAGESYFAVTDQSSAWCVLQLNGPKAREVLNAGCPLDLHPRVFGLGQCAQSVFFRFSILLRPLDEAGEHWEILVRRSHADAMVRMLLLDDYFL